VLAEGEDDHAPVAAESARDVDARTDVYALGLIAYEMLTRGSPFDPEATPIATVVKRRYEPPRSLRETLPDIEPAWEAAVARCLKADPARRFQRPAEFVAALRARRSR